MSDRILVVDDEELMQDLLREMLTKSGFEVAVAGDAEAGLEQLRRESFAVVLLDVRLPDLDGLALVEGLRSEPATRDLPVIALTAQAMAGDRERCLEAGANEYLSKPISLKRLVKVIETQLNRNPTGKGGVG